MGTGHSHVHGSTAPVRASRASRLVIVLIALALLAGTLVGLIRLWPHSSDVPRSALLAPGVELLDATVTDVPDTTDPSTSSTVTVVGRSAAIHDESIQVEVTPDVMASLHEGDRIRVLSIQDAAAAIGDDEEGDNVSASPQEPAAPIYTYFDHQRTIPLALLFLAYLVVVAVVARGNGLRAVVGLAVGVAIVVWFLLPAILAGGNPVLVALVAAGAMIFPSVYLAHGVSIRTTTALIGTFGGVAVTVLIALVSSRPAGMTGSDEETAQMLFGADPGISLAAVFLTGVIISGLGAFNDVTITQASSVWELRAAMPDGSRWEVFASAMRIGRDHIASTVYTLAYAYIGSALPVLLLASTIDRSLLDTLASGEIAAEVSHPRRLDRPGARDPADDGRRRPPGQHAVAPPRGPGRHRGAPGPVLSRGAVLRPRCWGSAHAAIGEASRQARRCPAEGLGAGRSRWRTVIVRPRSASGLTAPIGPVPAEFTADPSQ